MALCVNEHLVRHVHRTFIYLNKSTIWLEKHSVSTFYNLHHPLKSGFFEPVDRYEPLACISFVVYNLDRIEVLYGAKLVKGSISVERMCFIISYFDVEIPQHGQFTTIRKWKIMF